MTADETLVRELSKAPWPAYARVTIADEPFVFMLPRKCASNTIKDALARMPGCSFQAARDYLTARQLAESTAPRIAVVREPVSRLVSCWRHGVVRNRAAYLRVPGVTADMGWEAFAEFVCSTSDDSPACNYHFRSYSLELLVPRARGGGSWPDVVLRCERLEEDWEALTASMGWPEVPLRRLNDTSGPAVVVSDALRQRLNRRYALDAQNFGYGRLTRNAQSVYT